MTAHDRIMWTTCPHCGKRSYTSRKAAKLALRRGALDKMAAYRCNDDETRWHIGHLYAATRRGITYSQRASRAS